MTAKKSNVTRGRKKSNVTKKKANRTRKPRVKKNTTVMQTEFHPNITKLFREKGWSEEKIKGELWQGFLRWNRTVHPQEGDIERPLPNWT